MRMDLFSAASLVQKAIEGNFGALSRYGIKVDETLSLEEKQAQLLDKLEKMFGRAGAETETFEGRLKVLNNVWGDAKEALGAAITKNERVLELIKSVKEAVLELIESGKLDEWADRVAAGVTAAINALEQFQGVVSGMIQGANPFQKLAWDVTGMGKEVADVQEKILTFGSTLKNVKQNTEEAARYVMQGADAWAAYKQRLTELDAQLGKERAMKPFVAPDAPKDVYNLAAAIKELGGKDVAALNKTLVRAREALKAATEPGDVSFLTKKVRELEEAISGIKYVSPLERIKKDLDGLKANIEGLAGLYEINVGLKVGTRSLQEEIDHALDGIEIPDIPIELDLSMLEPQGMLIADVLGDAFDSAATASSEASRKIIDNIKSLTAGGTIAETKTKIAEIEEALTKTGLTAGKIRELKEELARLKDEVADTGKWDKLKNAVSGFAQYAQVAFSGLDSIFSQSQTNREIAIENEYKVRLAVINKTIKDEAKRQQAVQALEAELEIKRTSARRAGAKAQKAVSLMEAITNTAAGVAGALSNKPWTPFNFVLAAMTAALGAVQIGTIAAQPIPLAKGGYFPRATLMPGRDGRTYLGGEEGPEIMSPVPVMRQIVREESRAAAPVYNIKVDVTLNAQTIDEDVIDQIAPRLFRAIEGQLRIGRRL